MKSSWKFAGLKTPSGNLLKDYVSADKKFQARFDAFLRRQRIKELPWFLPDYRPLGDGVGELRVDYRKVEYRFYGYFGPGPRQFAVIMIGSGKKGQNAIINAAKKLKKQFDKSPPEVENYDV